MFCSGWDIHDQVYSRELLISNKSNGYRDILAVIDLSTFRRIPWENNSPSDFGSPNFTMDSMTSMASTSSLEYVNSQLVAHGFSPSPGLCLDGISNSDMDRLVKCLLDMLGQRVVS